MAFNPKAKVIVCSSMGSKYNTIEALNLGAKDFVVKPYFEQLLPTLDHLFA